MLQILKSARAPRWEVPVTAALALAAAMAGISLAARPARAAMDEGGYACNANDQCGPGAKSECQIAGGHCSTTPIVIVVGG